MEEIIVYRTDGRSLKFKGDLIASTRSSDNRAMGSRYSGSTGCHTRLYLYKTARAWVAERQNRTLWVGQRDTAEAKVCHSIDEITEFFGFDWLAQEIYDEAGIDISEMVE